MSSGICPNCMIFSQYFRCVIKRAISIRPQKVTSITSEVRNCSIYSTTAIFDSSPLCKLLRHIFCFKIGDRDLPLFDMNVLFAT